MKATLRLKIIGGFLVAMLAALAIGLYSRHTFSDFAETSEASASASEEDIQRIAEIESRYLTGSVYGAVIFEGKDAQSVELARPLYVAAMTDATNKLVAFQDAAMSPQARALYDKIVTEMSWSNKLANSFMGASFPVPDPSVTVPTIQELLADGGKAADARSTQLKATMGELRARIGADAAATRASVKEDADSSLRNITVVLVVVCVALAVFALWLSYVLVRRLRATVKVLERVAEGDLTARFDAGGHDEVAQMGATLNTSLRTLHDVVRQIEEDADRLATLARRQLPADGAGASASASAVVLDDSQGRAEELAEMATNLNAMVTVFVTDREPSNGSVPTRQEAGSGRPV